MKPMKPKHKEGDRIHKLAVVHVEGRSSTHPAKPGKHLVKPQWWYATVCDCGEREILYQDQIRKRTACAKCLYKKRYTAGKPGKEDKPADFVPFERMRW